MADGRLAWRGGARPRLRVGVDLAPPPPMCFGLPGEATFVGFEVDLLQAIGARLDRTLACEAALWADLLERLETDALDLICTAVTITPERLERFRFSVPYLDTGLTLVSPRTRPVATRAALAAAPAPRVGARINTPAERLARASVGAGGVVSTFHHNEEVYRALGDGALDVVIDDWPIGAWFAAQSPDLAATGIVDGTAAHYGLAMRRDDAALAEAVNATLAELFADGSYAASYRRWMVPIVGESCEVTRAR